MTEEPSYSIKFVDDVIWRDKCLMMTGALLALGHASVVHDIESVFKYVEDNCVESPTDQDRKADERGEG